MTNLNTNCRLTWDVEYYLNHIILDDLKNHSIDPTEENLQFSRDRIKDFLMDCLRVGQYFFYNFYGTWGDCGTVDYGVYHRWSYNFYLQKHFLSLSTQNSEPNVCHINKELDDTFKDSPRCVYILQKPPYLPHPEVIDACGLIPCRDRPGLRLWHNGGQNYRLAIKYEFNENPVKIPEEFYDQILAKNIPILTDSINYLMLKKSIGEK